MPLLRLLTMLLVIEGFALGESLFPPTGLLPGDAPEFPKLWFPQFETFAPVAEPDAWSILPGQMVLPLPVSFPSVLLPPLPSVDCLEWPFPALHDATSMLSTFRAQSPQTAPAPEPATSLLIGTALMLFGSVGRKGYDRFRNRNSR